MARRKRDYKAEYAASKRRATNAGYKSEREYRRVRKQLNLPPRTSPVPKRIIRNVRPEAINSGRTSSELSRLRREAKQWSDTHSLRKTSKYRDSMSDEEVRRYHRAFVQPVNEGSRRERARERRRRIQEWLVPDFMDYDEWASKYQPV